MNIFDNMVQNDIQMNQGRIYDHLSETPLLYPSDTLSELTKAAITKSQYESILDHIYRHDTLGIDSYNSVEKKIIDRFYERRWIK
ncbi:hypothetical protein FZW96_12130 [Bacillus sp. BGMRC 2118]|nr:hypothetical protein FZW96_12130 [Bacillus sp. BGMRC 2118]